MANMKAMFYEILKHFKEHVDADHLAQVVGGAACEGWINAEACVALNEVFQNRFAAGAARDWAIGEDRKRDIVVRTGGSGSPCRHVIEVKVVYPWPDSKIRDKLSTLTCQVGHLNRPGFFGGSVC